MSAMRGVGALFTLAASSKDTTSGEAATGPSGGG